MREFLLDAILKPFAAILFCLAFGVPFVYVGFRTVHVEGTRDGDGTVTINFARHHCWGLYKVARHVEGVTGADLSTSRLRRIGNRHRLVSGVFLTTPSESLALFAGSSNIDDDLKWDAV